MFYLEVEEITYRLCLYLSEVANVIRIDGEIIWHVLLLTEIDYNWQTDAWCGILNTVAGRDTRTAGRRTYEWGRRGRRLYCCCQVLNSWVGIEISG